MRIENALPQIPEVQQEQPRTSGGGEQMETLFGGTRILEYIDIGVMIIDVEHQELVYRNPPVDRILNDDDHRHDYCSLHDILLRRIESKNLLHHSAHVNQQVVYQDRLLGYSVYQPTPCYQFIFLRDITEKVRLESIAQAVNAMDNIGFIFSGIRHEIGNPLNSLKMALSVLKENLDAFPPETIIAYVNRGLADISRMEFLLKSLKAFSLYDHVDLAGMCFSDFMNSFVSLIRRDFQSHGISILVESPLVPAWVRVDKRALHQALLNVFTNAADALKGRKNPQICVSAELRGQLVWLAIQDNGCGMSETFKKRLFQPFNTSKPTGNGLGLVITRKLLAMMEANIDIVSEPDLGTQVTISLPVWGGGPENLAEGREETP